jgi:hypothetical protein
MEADFWPQKSPQTQLQNQIVGEIHGIHFPIYTFHIDITMIRAIIRLQ